MLGGLFWEIGSGFTVCLVKGPSDDNQGLVEITCSIGMSFAMPNTVSSSLLDFYWIAFISGSHTFLSQVTFSAFPFTKYFHSIALCSSKAVYSSSTDNYWTVPSVFSTESINSPSFPYLRHFPWLNHLPNFFQTYFV